MPVSVVIPTFRRKDELQRTLKQLQACSPAPDEVIVHIDFGDEETEPMLRTKFPAVRIITSNLRQGPGGGRNKLIRMASHNTVVSLDDDSWPLAPQFFAHAKQLVESRDHVAVYACEIIEADEHTTSSRSAGNETARRVSDTKLTAGFVGCGCIYRRDAFLQINGYLPLAQAYGMEEIDVALQFMDKGFELRLAKGLQVYHDCDRGSHHSDPQINAAQIRNTALLAILRYPIGFWPRAVLQVANRITFAVRRGRFGGIMYGVLSIPGSAWKYRKHRSVLDRSTLQRFWHLRRSESNLSRSKDSTNGRSQTMAAQ